MAKKGFNLAEYLTPANVPESGTDREQIVYLPLVQLHANEKNFYSLDGIDKLAANIELCGLQQPLRVRPDREGYVIVSGHRRATALRKLAGEGKQQFAEVACIIERGTESDAMRELRLIMANSDTRKLSSADLSHQAERVTELLYQLKKEGVEFPGRMRDHVAEACKISKTKLADLKVIREGLIPEWKTLWENGEVVEALALIIARMSEDHQRACLDNRAALAEKGRGYYAGTAEADRQRLQALDKITCPLTGDSSACANRDKKWEHIRFLNSWTDDSCKRRCCKDCPDLAGCKHVCPEFAERASQLKEQQRAAKREEKRAEAEREAPDLRRIAKLWQRFGQARTAAGVSMEEYCKATEINKWALPDGEEVTLLEGGKAKITTSTKLPYNYNCHLSDINKLIAAADALGVSLDWLLCRTDAPQAEKAELPTESEREFIDFTRTAPTREGWYYCDYAEYGFHEGDVFWWDEEDGRWCWSPGDPVGNIMQICGWYPLPQIK